MKYYVTIYIDPLIECFVDFKEKCFINVEDATHAFLGLTKDKSPDELDKIKFERDIERWNYNLGKMIVIGKEEYKWYEKMDTNEYNDGFWGFGSGTDSIFDTAGKVFDNNQYVFDNSIDKNRYIVKKLRSTKTFSPNNRCTLEISQEQYETLLSNIKKDYQATIEIKPQTKNPISDEFKYHIKNNNCVHWAIKKLSSIGIELIDEKYTVPGNFMEIFMYLKHYNTIFRKFQQIDSNLETIQGAKAFRKWTRKMIDNVYFFGLKFNDDKQYRIKYKKISPNTAFQITVWKNNAYKLMQVYKILNELLNRLIKQQNIKGQFIFIYNDRENSNKKIILKPTNNYQEQDLNTIDLKIPANNFSASEFYPFIFIPDDEMIARILYHEYDYGTFSPNYTRDTMVFYFAFLEGREIKDYWSEAFHKINKRIKDEYQFA